MKNKFLSLITLIVIFIAQFTVPILFIKEKENILSVGDEYKFYVTSLTDDDDDVIKLFYENTYFAGEEYMRYTLFSQKENEYYSIDGLSKQKPESELYFISASSSGFALPFDTFSLDSDNAAAIAAEAYRLLSYGRTFYSTVKILDGKAILTGVYLDDGTPLEDILLL